MKRMLPLAILIVVVIAAAAYMLTQNNVTQVAVTSDTNATEATEASEASEAMAEESQAADTDMAETADAEITEAAAAKPEGIQDMVMGAADAPITMIEYASYTCPHCGSFHNNVFPQLKADYIDTGKVKFIFREVYFDRFGLWASMIARCGGEERFFGITDLMFKGQSDWTSAGEPTAIVEGLRKIGRLAGLNDADLELCLQDQTQAEALVEWYQENATRDDVNSTPSFLINGKKYANMSYADMQALLDGML